MNSGSKILIDLIADENKVYLESKKAGASPEVGVWWIIEGKVYSDTLSLNDADFDIRNHVKYNKTTHSFFWAKLIRFLDIPQDTDYREYTRGRILYRTEDRVWEIWGSEKTMNNPVAVSKIREYHRIPNEAVVETKTDPHYEV